MVESKHFNDYDLLRIFAILFVVIGHSAYTIINGDYGGVNYQLPQNLAPAYNGWLLSIQRYLAGWVYGFHMPLFFILSGAVYAISDSYSYDTLCKKKLKRLFMPYWLYGLGFMIPVKWLANFYDNHTANVAYVNLLGGGSAGHLWFLLALFWVFIVFWIVQRISLGSLCAMFLISLFVQFYHNYLPFNILYFQLGMSYFIWFCIGYIFHKNRKNFYITKFGSIALLYIMTFVMIIETKYLSANATTRILVRSVWIYAVSVCILKTFPSLVKNRGYQLLLRNCFYIYIFHDPLEFLILRLAFEFDLLTSNLGCYIYAIFRTAGIIFVSVLIGEAVVWFKKNCAEFCGLKVRR